MTTIRTGALVLVALAGLHLAQAGAAEPAAKPELEEVEIEFWAAIGAHGATYEKLRDRLVRRGPAIKPFLEKRAKDGETWQERTLAAILLERLEKGGEVDAVLRAEPLPYVQGFGARWEAYGKAFAGRCKETPMLLVEKVWKDVGLDWVKPSGARAYAAVALGRLREPMAVEPLIDMASESHPLKISSPLSLHAPCFALRDLGDPRAVPVLLRTYLLYAGETTGTMAAEALMTSMDEESIRLVQTFGLRIRDPNIKNHLLLLANKRELEFERKRRKRKTEKD